MQNTSRIIKINSVGDLGLLSPGKESLFQLILGLNTTHITCDQEAPHLVFGLWSVQVAQAHPEKGLHSLL